MLFSRLTALATVLAVAVAATFAIAAQPAQPLPVPQARLESAPVVQLDRVVVTGKRLAAPAR